MSIVRPQSLSGSHLDACVQFATPAVTIYDYILTFALEKSEIWTGRFTLTKAFFVLNRYTNLGFTIFHLWAFIYLPSGPEDYFTFHRCSAFVRVYECFNIFPVVCIRCIFLLRTFALYDRNRLVLALFGFLALMIIASHIAAAIIIKCVPLYFPSLPGPLKKVKQNIHVSAYASKSFTACTILTSIFDSFVFIMTLLRTRRMSREAKNLGIKNSLWTILMRDGIFYYIVIFIPGSALLVCSAISTKANIPLMIYLTDNIIPIGETLSSIMTTRLVLNLSHSVNQDLDMVSNPDLISLHISSRFSLSTGARPRTQTSTFTDLYILGNVDCSVRSEADSEDDE